MGSHEALKKRIKGPVYSIITPFDKDEIIDYISLENYIDYVYRCGGTIFFVMAYNSRFSQLSNNEIKELNEFVTNKVKSLSQKNIVIVADPIHCSTKVSIEFARHAKTIGADIISLIFREKYYSDDQVYNHYKKVATEADTPILIHEMAFLSGYGEQLINYPVKLLDRLADIDNVVAIKEDAKDDVLSLNIINTIKDRVSIIISGGGKQQWMKFSREGCQAWLNGIGVFDPRLAIKFWTCYQSGNVSVCERIINDIEKPFFECTVKKYGWHRTIKAALEFKGFMKRCERMPMVSLDDNSAEEVSKVIHSLPIEEIINL